MNILAVIPARGGSKGIPRKNMRLMGGKPLISYAIENAISSQFITDIVVSSDSDELLGYARTFEEIIAIDRDPSISGDSISLDPVIFDALNRAVEITGKDYDIVVTLQPTSPLLTVEVLDKAIEYFIESNFDSLISVVNSPHLSWRDGENGTIIPAYAERVNRQLLPSEYRETGAFFVSRRNIVSMTDRLGKKIGVYEIPEDQSIDIDTLEDWMACECILGKKRIAIRADGYRQLGMGHIYRAMTIAYALTGHDITFLCSNKYPEGIQLLKSANLPVVGFDDDDSMLQWLKDKCIDIFISDQLDTTRDYIDDVKRVVPRVVTFEDNGSGARHADIVINALYEQSPMLPPSFYCGEKYACLRDEFLIAEPKPFSEEVKNIFVMFGGSDPLDLTSKIYRLARRINNASEYRFDFVLGLPYMNTEIVDIPEENIYVHRNAVRVSDYMGIADLAFTSQGRSTFELASMGVPSVVMAQNPRETSHFFAQMSNGFINLGLGSNVSEEDIESTFYWLVKSPNIRREMRSLMLAKDLKSGVDRVKRIILGLN